MAHTYIMYVMYTTYDTLEVFWTSVKKIVLYTAFLFVFSPILHAETIVNLDYIAFIESSSNPLAVGDNGNALGLFQLHKCVIDDFNAKHHTSYPHQIAFNPIKSKEIASWYLQERIPTLLRHFKRPVNLSNVITAYNMGIKSVLMGKTATKYLKKYKKLKEAT